MTHKHTSSDEPGMGGDTPQPQNPVVNSTSTVVDATKAQGVNQRSTK